MKINIIELKEGVLLNTKLIIVRHAETDGNHADIFHGWTNVDISEKGKKQAEKLAERLKNQEIDVLYSSSLTRAIQTAEYISNVKGISIIKSDGLKEINGGDWENVEYKKLPELFPKEHHTWRNALHLHQMPNGESMIEFQKRLINEISKIVKENKGKSICIVTHGNAIKALMCYFHNLMIEDISSINWTENTSISIININDKNEYEIEVEGDASHLNKDLYTLLNQEWYIKLIKEKQNRN